MKDNNSHWKARLPDACYKVLFEEKTEKPFSSALNGETRHGVYVCAACGNPIFRSEAKFDSNTGWPSFDQALPGALLEQFEYKCAQCHGHHGHLFHDGPTANQLRYCNNGVSLTFVPDNPDEKDLS